jgi:excisionase family DNA binding protein
MAKRVLMAAVKDEAPAPRPLVFDAEGAAYQLAISERQVWTLIAEGQLNALRLGRRVVITNEELTRFVATLPAWEPQEAHG